MKPPEDVLTPEFRPSIWRTIDRIRSTLGWDQKVLCEHLGLTAAEHGRLRAAGSPLPAASGLLLANHLQVRAEDLAAGRIDLVALERAHFGAECFLPERYSKGAFSRKRTSLHLIDYCEKALGPEFVDDLFRTLQVRRAAYSNPEEFVSIQSLMDISDFIANSTGSKRLLYKAGANQVNFNRNTQMGRALAGCRTVREAYELQISENIVFFDRNCHYRLVEATETHCVFESSDRSEVLDALEVARLGNTNTCMTRAGVAAAIAGFLDVPLAHVVEVLCIHRGDAICRFNVDYEFSRHALLKRRRGDEVMRLRGGERAQASGSPRARPDSPTGIGHVRLA